MIINNIIVNDLILQVLAAAQQANADGFIRGFPEVRCIYLNLNEILFNSEKKRFCL